MSWNNDDVDGEYLRSLLEDSDEDEDFELTRSVLLGVLLAAGETKSSNTFFVRDRIEWNLHVASLLKEGNDSFRRMYRMEGH